MRINKDKIAQLEKRRQEIEKRQQENEKILQELSEEMLKVRQELALLRNLPKSINSRVTSIVALTSKSKLATSSFANWYA